MILTISVLAVGLTSCSDKKEYEMERNTDAKVSEFKDWAEDRSDDIEERMEQLENDMSKAGAGAKTEMKATWNNLEKLNNRIEAKISEMSSEARPEWEEFKNDVDSEWTELKRDSRNFFYSE